MMKLILNKKLKILIYCVSILSCFTLYSQDRLVINGASITIRNDTLNVKGNIIVNNNDYRNINIRNYGVIILSDTLINFVPNLFFSTSAPEDLQFPSQGKVIFSGTKKQLIFGSQSNMIFFNDLVVDNPENIELATNIKAFGIVDFKQGNISLNGFNIDLYDTSTSINRCSGLLLSESDYHKIVDPHKTTDNCGYVRAYSKSVANPENIGNLGASVSLKSSANVLVERGHVPLFVIKDTSFSRFYNFYSSNIAINDTARITFTYRDSDFPYNSYDEKSLSVFSTDIPSGTYFRMHPGENDSENNTITVSNLNLLRKYLIGNSGRICEDTIKLSLPEDIYACAGDTVILDPNPQNNIGKELFFEWYQGTPDNLIDTKPSIKIVPDNDVLVQSYIVNVSNEYGCTNSDTVRVHTNKLPSVGFMARGFHCENDSVHFTDTSSIDKGSLHYFWNFGDYTTSTDKNPIKKYDHFGRFNVSLRCISDSGCSVRITKPLDILDNPEADFNYGIVCNQYALECTNISTTQNADNQITQSLWDFSGTQYPKKYPEALLSVTHIYGSPGSYDVKLKVTSHNNCVDSVIKKIIIPHTDIADFSIQNICFGDTTTFTNLSSSDGTNISYKWDFGDSQSSLDFSARHKYSAPGEYFVTLMLINNNCTTSTTKKVNIKKLPDAGFTHDIAYLGCSTGLYNITKDTLKYKWTIDGNESVLPNPFYVFTTTDSHTVKLEVTSFEGCKSELKKDLLVSTADTAKFEVSDLCSGTTSLFKNTSVTCGKSVIYNWDFGDSEKSTETSPEHTYKSAGEYNVSLTLNNLGKISTFSKKLIVKPSPDAGFTYNIPCRSNTINLFNNTADSLVYKWTFDDKTSSDPNTSFGFRLFGTHKLKLEVLSANGCITVNEKTIDLIPPDTADFITTNLCFGDTTKFVNTSIIHGDGAKYDWDFGDSNNSDLKNPLHYYTSPGSYVVNLTIHNNGCTVTKTKTISFTSPSAEFSYSLAPYCVGNPVYFNNSTTDSLDYKWYFDGKLESVKPNILFAFNTEGTHLAVLEVKSFTTGCKFQDTVVINVDPVPFRDFEFSTECFGNPTSFQNKSYLKDAELSYKWNFNNLGSSDKENPAHILEKINNTVELTVTSDKGCSSKISKTVSVYPLPATGLNDTVYTCKNELTLSAQEPFASYAWSNGSHEKEITVNNSGKYFLTVTDSRNCNANDSTYVFLNTVPKPELGDDHSECGSDILDAGYPGMSYQWSTGETTRYITIHESGSYKVRVYEDEICEGSDSIYVEINKVPGAYLKNDTLICKGDTIELDAGPDGISYLWSDRSENQTTRVVNAGIYSVRVENEAGCVSFDTIAVQTSEPPQIQLPVSLEACGNITVSAGNEGFQYNWSTGESSQSVIIKQTGEYSLSVYNNICTRSHDFHVDIYDYPGVNLGNDTAICEGDTIELDAGSEGSDYLWSGNYKERYLKVFTTGRYNVSVTSSNGCTSFDTIQIMVNQPPQIDFPDKIEACEEINLNAGNDGYFYEWSTNETTPSITIYESGEYWVSVYDNVCRRTDTFVVEIHNYTIVNLGNDTSICAGNKLLLNAGSDGISYLWSDGSVNQTLEVSKTNLYSVEVTNSDNCIARDTIDVVFTNLPKINLDDTIEACDYIVLDAGNAGSSFNWSTGENTEKISINKTGTYKVTVTDKNNCSSIDSVYADIITSPLLLIPEDIYKCENEEVTIAVNDLGPGYSYIWSNGLSGASIKTASTGQFTVTVTGERNCSSSGTVSVYNNPLPVINLPDEQYLCNKTEILDAGEGYDHYIWNSETGISASTQNITVSTPGKYWVDVVSADGCSSSDTTIVKATADTVKAMFLVAGAFEEEDTAFRAGDTVYFYNFSVPENADFYWDFGDDSYSFEAQPYHIYYKTGTFTISLTVNSRVCSETISKTRAVKGYAFDWRKSGNNAKNKDNKRIIFDFTESKLYPNPAKEFLNFEFTVTKPANLSMSIVDINGRYVHFEKLYVESKYSKRFNLNELPSGLYIIRVASIYKTITYKFIRK